MPITVNGDLIEPAEIAHEIERMRPQYDQHVRPVNDDASEEELEKWATENVIERALVRQAAAKDDRPVDAAKLEEAFEKIKDQIGDTPVAKVKAEIELHMRIDRFIQETTVNAETPSDEVCRTFYDENIEQMTSPMQIRASHIIKNVTDEAGKAAAHQAIMEVKVALDASETPAETFAELCAAHSDCPDNGGDLGFFPQGQMVPAFEETVFAMQPGEISDVFLTEFGYHIATVTDRRDEQTAPFEEVQAHIAQYLTDQHRQQALDAHVDTLKKAATIERE